MRIEIDKKTGTVKCLVLPLELEGQSSIESTINRRNIALIGIALGTGAHILKGQSNYPQTLLSFLSWRADIIDETEGYEYGYSLQPEALVLDRQETEVSLAGLEFLSNEKNLGLKDVMKSDKNLSDKLRSVKTRRSLSKAARVAIKNINEQKRSQQN